MHNTKKNFFTFNIQKIINKKVNIFVFEKLKFSIKRFYFLTNLKKNTKRDGHSHKKLEQIYICVNGKIEVKLISNNRVKKIILVNSKKALYVGNNVWREIKSLKKDSILCVLASQKYNEIDYIRKISDFKKKNKIS